jgi:hypothetical protein
VLPAACCLPCPVCPENPASELRARGCCSTEYYRAQAEAGNSPIGFNEIDRKLLNGAYASFADFGADVEQVFMNCHHLNSEDTLIYQDASALQLAYREAAPAVPFAADVVPEASGASAKTLAANEPGTLAAPPLLPQDGGAVDDTHTARRASRVSAKDITGNEQSAPHAKVYAKKMTADVKQKRHADHIETESNDTSSKPAAAPDSTAGKQTSSRDPGEPSSGLAKPLGRGVWKKSAVDIMAMLKAVKDGEGVFLAAEFLALPDRSEYPGAACCLLPAMPCLSGEPRV